MRYASNLEWRYLQMTGQIVGNDLIKDSRVTLGVIFC